MKERICVGLIVLLWILNRAYVAYGATQEISIREKQDDIEIDYKYEWQLDGSSTDSEKYISLIETMVEYQNLHLWFDWSSLWCNEWNQIYDDMLNDEYYIQQNCGITAIDSAVLTYIDEVGYDDAEDYIKCYIDKERYSDVKLFMIGIDYSIEHANKYIYNGINYRFLYIGREEGKLVILRNSEVPMGYLEKVANGSSVDNSTKYILNPYEQTNTTNILTAINIRSARLNGYIVDSDMRVVDTITDDVDHSIEVYNDLIEDNSNMCFSLRPGYTYTKGYYGYIPSTIKIGLLSDENRKKANNATTYMIGFKDYIKNTILNELAPAWVADHPEFPNRAAGYGAQLIITKQYALWYTIYEYEYPDAGVDLYDIPDKDQCFTIGGYDKLASRYKKVIDDAIDEYYKRYIVCREYRSLFCTRYRSTVEKAQKVIYGCLAQETLMKSADEGKTTGTILQYAYQFTKQEGIENIGFITYK